MSFKKILFISVPTFLIILTVVELAMRFSGFVIISKQDALNKIHPEDQDLIRILTVGESTTADVFSESNQGAWPRQLEQILNKSAKKFRVYNMGRSSISTGNILAELPDQLTLYKPHIVISMMGINDSTEFNLKPSDSFFLSLKIVRLYSWAKKSLEKKDIHSYEALGLNKTYNFSKELVELIQKNDVTSIKDVLLKEVENVSSVERSKYLSDLGFYILPPIGKNDELAKKSLLLLEWSLDEYFADYETLMQALYLMPRLKMYDNCLPLVKKYVKIAGRLDDFGMLAVNHCVDSQVRSNEWLQLLNANDAGLVAKWSSDPDQNLRESYRDFYKTLKKNKILYLAMQYPNRNIEEIKQEFSPEDQKDIIFISNEQNFKEALKKYKWDDLFTDRFGYDVGHTTDKGHGLIATQACEGIKRALGSQGHRLTFRIDSHLALSCL